MRWIVGLLLVTASVLKTAQLVVEPSAMHNVFFARWFMPWQIGLELAIGLLALSGIYWRHVRWIGLIIFAGFAGYSLFQALSGVASCGSFGPVQVHPWWTFNLDVAVVVGLAVSMLRERQASDDLDICNAGPVMYSPWRRRVIAATMGVAVVSAALLARYMDHLAAAADDLSSTAGGLVVLEPETWVGKELPISKYIDVDLSSGHWIALLHRHDCPSCQVALPHYENLAASGERVALVEVPPYGEPHSIVSACRHSRLSDDRDWFVQTPVEVQLQDGLVTAVKSHDH